MFQDKKKYIEELTKRRSYNVVLYMKSGNDVMLDYDIIYPGDKHKLLGAIKSDTSLDLEYGGVVAIKYSEVLAIEIRGGEPYEEE